MRTTSSRWPKDRALLIWAWGSDLSLGCFCSAKSSTLGGLMEATCAEQTAPSKMHLCSLCCFIRKPRLQCCLRGIQGPLLGRSLGLLEHEAQVLRESGRLLGRFGSGGELDSGLIGRRAWPGPSHRGEARPCYSPSREHGGKRHISAKCRAAGKLSTHMSHTP